MPSTADEAMVAQIIATGQRTPEATPTPEVMAATRASEHVAVPPAPEDMRVEDTPGGRGPLHRRVTVSGRAGRNHRLRARRRLHLDDGAHALLVAAARAAGAGASASTTAARRTPYPAPVEDLVAVYRSLLDDGVGGTRSPSPGTPPGVAWWWPVWSRLRDAGPVLPAAALSISPWTDLTVTGASADTLDDPIVSGTALRMMASMYLDGASPTSPTASPLYADLTGLPPLLVQVGTREALLDDALGDSSSAPARPASMSPCTSSWTSCTCGS